MTVKSIFVPESYLREEIRAGYDQAGGDAEAAPAKAPLVEFQPVEDAAQAEDETKAADEDEAGPAADLFQPDSDSEAGDDVADGEAADGPIEEPESRELFDSIQRLGEPEDPEPVATGGGLFGSDFATVLQTMMVSGNNMPIADSMEDIPYELNGIKSYLDSIAQSLAKIAEKYAGDNGYGNNKKDRQGNKPWNNDKGNKQWNNDKGNKQSWNDRGDDVEPEALIEDGLDE